jgi:hypothetical protein
MPFYGLCPYKAGSTMLFNYMMDICEALNIQYVNYPGWLWSAGHNLTETCYAPANAVGIYGLNMVYAGNREPISGIGSVALKSARSFTMIRDPRDCLVSMYFSFLGSHPAPDSLTQEQKIAWSAHKQMLREETPIDVYVVQEAPKYKANVLSMLAFAAKTGKADIIRYEDFVLDKIKLCAVIMDALCNSLMKPIEARDINLEPIAKARDMIPENERPNQHVRRAIPGDHIDKLNPETIDQLNLIFDEVLLRYGYMSV